MLHALLAGSKFKVLVLLMIPSHQSRQSRFSNQIQLLQRVTITHDVTLIMVYLQWCKRS